MSPIIPHSLRTISLPKRIAYMPSSDLKYALRSLTKDRAFSLTVILTLALGIGTNTAIFSVVDGVLLRPLAYRDPARLVSVTQTSPKFLARVADLPLNIGQFVEWRKQSHSFESISIFRASAFNLTGSGSPELVSGAVVSANLFHTLGVTPQLGRTFFDSEDLAGHDHIAIISDSLWRRRFSADPQITSRTLTLEGRSYQIAGVLPPSFELPRMGETGPRLAEQLEIFNPLGHPPDEAVFDMVDFNYWSVLRLRPGVTAERASAELNAIQTAMTAKVSSDAQLIEQLYPLQDRMTGPIRKGLIVLMSAVGAVLLILCVNLANLALGRSLAHSRDAAIRTALGANRARLLRTAFLESAILSFTGGILGMAVAWFALRALIAAAPVDIPL